MFWTKNKASTRKVILSVAVLCLAAVALITGAQFNSTDASTAVSASALAAAPDATFPGTGTGAIPDGLAGTPPQFGAPRVINFVVSGVTGNVTNVTVNMTLTHTWVGDVDVILRAPAGTPSMVVVSRIGVTTAGSFGSASDYGGLYNFSDAAAGPNIWTAAAANPVPPGTYRTTAPGQTGQTNPAPVTSLNTTFGGMTPAAANGTWTLTFRDAASADLGTVTAANLTVEPTGVAPPADGPVDFNNDGRTDYVVVRNIQSPNPAGQIRWFYNLSSGGPTVAKDWGLAGDFFISGDWDTDGNDDIAVWRPGPATVATFYVLRSTNFTAIIEPFGQTGDDPTIVGDYNNDGTTDFAVYRAGVTAGANSTWFYRTAQGGPITYVLWGVNGDFVAPGDYNGDGSYDFVIQRTAGASGQFWRRLSTGAVSVVTYGLFDDIIVPGDYDGDGSTDIAVVRDVGTAFHWYHLRSIDGVSVGPTAWGLSASDFFAQGDYDGDGKVEPGIWRNGTFISLNSSNGAATFFSLGASGDYPVADFNSH